MDITILPGKLKGRISVIPSKSQAHRLLICSAFADAPVRLICPETNRDMEATADCLEALGATIHRTDWGYHVFPAHSIPRSAVLNCRDSGSTLRFLLPVAGALGVDTVFQLAGRLPQRPLSPLWEEMERMGCSLFRPDQNSIRCTGKLRAGEYRIAGNVSSQFLSGLLLALPLLPGDSRIEVLGKLESKPYVDMTMEALKAFSLRCSCNHIPGGQILRSPGQLQVEGDWSNGAFFHAANALGSDLQIMGLSDKSCQGDRAIVSLLSLLESPVTFSAADIPDLVPILAVTAAQRKGAVITDISRLRLKESDRVASVIHLITALGGRAEASEHTLTVYGTGLTGGIVDAENDHRIAMAAAIASTVCSGPVTVLGAECVEKSYPQFWEEFKRLGGNYEQSLR